MLVGSGGSRRPFLVGASLLLAFAFVLPQIVSHLGAGREQVEILIHCGAGLRPAMESVIGIFEAREPAVRVRANYAGSDKILAQIALSRQGDLFMPGEASYVELASAQNLVEDETCQTVAQFVPVILVRKGNPLGVVGLRSLAERKLRLGLGDPRSNAVGKQTLKILEKNAIIRSEVWENVVFESGTVSELGTAVAMGSVDAAVVWDATARQFADSTEIIPIPSEHNIITDVPVVRLRFSRHSEAAARFIRFLISVEGQQAFRGQGYSTVSEGGE